MTTDTVRDPQDEVGPVVHALARAGQDDPGADAETARLLLVRHGLAGGAGVIEFVTDTVTDEKYVNYAWALDLGAGLLFAGGKADIRLAYEFLLGSGNLGGQAVVSFGYRF